MSKQLGKHAIVGAVTVLAVTASLAPAHAADIPGSTKTQATLKVATVNDFTRGVFERSSDSDWYRVSLTKGKHYYIAMNGPDELTTAAIVRNSSGKELKRGLDYPGIIEGYEFLAPYTGTYYVDYRVPGGIPATYVPSGYSARVSTDCAGSLATTCVQKVGQTRKSLIGAAYDKDWFRASLSTSKTYTVKASTSGGCDHDFRIGIADATGKNLVFGHYYGGGGFAIDGFRPPSNGTYFLTVNGDECTVLYSLSLTTP